MSLHTCCYNVGTGSGTDLHSHINTNVFHPEVYVLPEYLLRKGYSLGEYEQISYRVISGFDARKSFLGVHLRTGRILLIG